MTDWIEAPAGKFRLLLLDDHVLFRNGLSRALTLEPDMHVVGEAETVSEAISMIQSNPVDLVLMNVEMPGHAVLDFLGRLSSTNGNRPKVVGLVAGMNGYQVQRLLRAGIDGLHPKRESLTRLCEMLRRLGSGKAALDSAWLVALRDRQQAAGADTKRLTTRESRVLRGVVRGLTSKEIAYELNSTEAGVKSVIQQLFEKTGVRSRAQLVRLAMERFGDLLEDFEAEVVKH